MTDDSTLVEQACKTMEESLRGIASTIIVVQLMMRDIEELLLHIRMDLRYHFSKVAVL